MPKGFMDYGHLQWDHNGNALWRHVREVPCTGPDGNGCQGRWKDDYDDTTWCRRCAYGNGKMAVERFIRVPRYDAPRPPKSWKGPGARTIDKAYGGSPA